MLTIIRETKIKTFKKYNYKLIRKTDIEDMTIPSVGKDVELREHISYWWVYKMVELYWKTVWEFL